MIARVVGGDDCRAKPRDVVGEPGDVAGETNGEADGELEDLIVLLSGDLDHKGEESGSDVAFGDNSI